MKRCNGDQSSMCTYVSVAINRMDMENVANVRVILISIPISRERRYTCDSKRKSLAVSLLRR